MMVKERKFLRDSLESFADHLRKTVKEGYVQEFTTEAKTYRNKVVFRFPNGTFDFIVKTNIHFHQRRDQLISTYAQLDDRFVAMGSFLSFWAHQRGIFKEQYLLPHALYIMIIFFLMIQSPPILPNIYNPAKNNTLIYKKRGLKIQGKDEYHMMEVVCDFNYEENYLEIKEKMSRAPQNPMSVGELVAKFFYTFAFEIPNSGYSISIKEGRLVKQKCPSLGYSVCDPFNPEYDLCKTLKKTSMEFIVVKEEFERAFKCIQDEKIKDLCEKFNG